MATDLATFLASAGGDTTGDPTLQAIAPRLKLAQAMSQTGLDTSPTGHPLQAIARIAQAGAGQYVQAGAISDLSKMYAAQAKGAARALEAAAPGSPMVRALDSDDPNVQRAALQQFGPALIRLPEFMAQHAQHEADQRRAQFNADRTFGEQQRQFNVGAEGGKVPPGFERAEGGMRPIPGGPASPEYKATEVEAGLKPISVKPGEILLDPKTHKPLYQNTSGTFSDDALKSMVSQYRAGDKSVLTNVGRGAQGGENIGRFRDMLAQQLTAEGLTGKDQAAVMANFGAQSAAAKTAAVRESNVETSINEALATFPLAVEASKAVPRKDFVPYNKLVQLVKSGTSNVEQGKFLTSLQGAITAYSQAMSRTGTNSVHAQQSAEHLLSSVTSHEELVGRLEQMEKEMHAAKVAPELTRKAILDRISGRGSEGGKPPSLLSGGTPFATEVAPAVSPPSKREAGQTYPTPKGPMTWTGTGWVPAQAQ